MKCELRKRSHIYERHGNGLCSKLFRNDKSPPERKIKSKAEDQILIMPIESTMEMTGLPR